MASPAQGPTVPSNKVETSHAAGNVAKVAEVWKQLEGQVVNGRFRLQHYLGGSERSAVFLTERGEREPQKAALKLIPEDPRSGESQLARWELGAKLSHPHLIRLFETGRCRLGDTALLYVVMEYAEENLAQILPQRPLTPTESLEMLAPVLSALAYIHGEGLVHGHVKPANIMAVADQLRLSSDGLSVASKWSGKPGKTTAYDSPEAANGNISPAADVWSLGMTLVEVLTQRVPAWDARLKRDPRVPEVVPAPFGDIARHCLRVEPHRRWTLAEITARLQSAQVLSEKPEAAQPPKPVVTKRFLVPAIAVALALAALLAGPRLRNRRPAPVAPTSSVVEQPQVEPQPKPTPVTPAATPPRPMPDEKKHSSVSAAKPATSEPAAQTIPESDTQDGVVTRVVPEVPRSARNTITGKVRVRVKATVDASGNVTRATLVSPGPSQYFARLALQAAQRWKFAPAQAQGQDTPSEWILRFAFGRKGTEVYPRRTTP